MPGSKPAGQRRLPQASALRERLAAARASAARVAEEEESPTTGNPIPSPIRLAAGWSVRLILIAAGIYLGLLLLDQLAVVVIPTIVALLLVALLEPLIRLFRRLGLPRGLAAPLAFLVGIAAIGGLITLIVRELVTNYDTIVSTVGKGVSRTTKWLEDGPLHIQSDQIDAALTKLLNSLRSNPGDVVSGTLTVVTTATGALGGLLLVLLTTYFFLADGARVWRWIVRLFPVTTRWKVNRAGARSWEVLVSYMTVTLIVAAIVGIAVWAACLIAGVPLALSAGLVAFLFAFIPTLGGVISSIVVILLTLVSSSLTVTVVMAIVMVGIQTVQGNVIYPFLMNRQLKVHPLASLLLVVLGSILGGVFGALIAVPFAAVVNTAWIELLRASRGLPEEDKATPLGPTDEDEEPDASFVDPTVAPDEQAEDVHPADSRQSGRQPSDDPAS